MDSSNSNDSILRDIGTRLKQQRVARDMDQKTLAFESGVPLRTLSRLENGHSASLETLIKVLRALDLIERLDLLLPEPGVSPVDRMRTGKKTPRQRVRGKSGDRDTKEWSGFSNPVSFEGED